MCGIPKPAPDPARTAAACLLELYSLPYTSKYTEKGIQPAPLWKE